MSARCRILPVFIPHLGCPYACVFCNQREITGRAAESAYASLETLCQTDHPTEELALYGGSFTALPRREILRYLELAYGHFGSVRISTRPDAIDREILCLLRKYGVETIELGAQSMSDTVLQLSGRGHTAEDVERASGMINEAGFRLVLQMMTGLPGDSDEQDTETARRLIALRPAAVRIYPTVVVRGTRLETLWRQGVYQEHSVEDAVRIGAVLYRLFSEANIPIIRLGLNPTDELTKGGALAGAYHPALGELIRSRALRNLAEENMEKANWEGKRAELFVRPELVSQMTGQRRCNVSWLTERFRLSSLKIRSDPTLQNTEMRIEERL